VALQLRERLAISAVEIVVLGHLGGSAARGRVTRRAEVGSRLAELAFGSDSLGERHQASALGARARERAAAAHDGAHSGWRGGERVLVAQGGDYF